MTTSRACLIVPVLAAAVLSFAQEAAAGPICARPPCAGVPDHRPPGDRLGGIDVTRPELNLGIEFSGPFVRAGGTGTTHRVRRGELVRLIATGHDRESRVRSVAVTARVLLFCVRSDGRTIVLRGAAPAFAPKTGDAIALRAYANLATAPLGTCPGGFRHDHTSVHVTATATNRRGLGSTTPVLRLELR
jgi:hypothetical protein